MSSEKKIKLLLAKIGLDTHDYGTLVLARGLRDAGIEVIYAGMRQTPEGIVKAAIQEDANIIGVSMYCGGHDLAAKDLMSLLRESTTREIPVIFGGTIPRQDVPELEGLGVAKAFLPGCTVKEVVDFIKQKHLK